MVCPWWRTVWRFLKKLKIELPYHSAVGLWVYISKRTQNTNAIRYTPMFIAVLFIIAKIRKPPKCPREHEWLKKICCKHTTEYYLATKRNEILPFAATQVDLKSIMLSEISQTEKDKYCMTSLICGI